MNIQILKQLTKNVQLKIHNLNHRDFVFHNEGTNQNFDEEIKNFISSECQSFINNRHVSCEDITLLPNQIEQRLIAEFLDLGPLVPLIQNVELTEILVNGPSSIWYEKDGRLVLFEDHFLSDTTFQNIIDRLLRPTQKQLTLSHPYIDSTYKSFRLTIVGESLTKNSIHLSLRRHPENPWNFSRLIEYRWCQESDSLFFRNLINLKKNFLIIGGTGSGKTSILNSFIQLISANERVIAIEDTPEIALQSTASMKLLTRFDPNQNLPTIDQCDLVKKSLRLRPDRIVMGEIRGNEAKDFLMALSTGHDGSFGTLHANSPQQALIRLEMLIQLGAPEWSLLAIRRLIQLSLHYIIGTERSATGGRVLSGIYKITSLEDYGFTLEKINPLQSH